MGRFIFELLREHSNKRPTAVRFPAQRRLLTLPHSAGNGGGGWSGRTMSTSQRSGRSNGKSNGRASSLRKKQRVGTPGRTGRGVEFEAAVVDTPTAPRARADAAGTAGSGNTAESKGEGAEGEGMDTFSYEDVSNLATVTPVVPKRAMPRVAGEEAEPPPPQQQPVGKGKKRAAEPQGEAGAST